MSYSFSGSGEDLKASGGGNSIRQPGIYKAILTEVHTRNPSKDTTKNFNVLVFEFKITEEGPYKDTTHRHIEWEPTSQDKADNCFKRVGHIIAHFMKADPQGESREDRAAKAIDADSWDNFRKKVLDIFNNKIGKERMEKRNLSIKLLGSVIAKGRKAGETQFGFPGYIGFIADDQSETPLRLSMSELRNNEEYLAKEAERSQNRRNATPTNPDNDDDMPSSGGSGSFPDDSGTAPGGGPTEGGAGDWDDF